MFITFEDVSFVFFATAKIKSKATAATGQPQWVFDKDTLRFLDVNDAAIQLYGYSRKEFLQMSIRDIRPPFDVPKLDRHITVHYNRETYRDVWKHKKKNGDILFVMVSSSQQMFNGSPAWYVTITDLTPTLVAYNKDYSG